VSTFTTEMFTAAPVLGKGLVTGEPHAPVRHTWAEVHCAARRMAGSLAQAGVRPGDSIAILAGEPVDIAPLIQAVWMRGASVTMLHQPTPRADLVVWLQNALTVLAMIGAHTVLVGPPFGPAAAVLIENGISVHAVEALSGGSPIEPFDGAEEDIAFLQLTSGSTGIPKAVAISHRNLDQTIRAMAAATKVDATTDVMVNWLPLFHDMGMIGFLVAPMAVGVEAVCITPTEFLTSPLVWPALITKYGGTMTAAPNFAYTVLARRLHHAADNAYDLSSLRFVLNGAEPIDITTVTTFLESAGRFGLKETAMVAGYGMAEATLAVSFTNPGDTITVDTVDTQAIETAARAMPSKGKDTRSFVKLGSPLPGIEFRVVDEDGSALQHRQIGELAIRGVAVTRSYVTPAGRQIALDADGWLATGDLGYRTETGEIVVCGRKKDMIIVAGRNIFPTDIERVAGRVDGVRPGNAVAVRLTSPAQRESFAVAVESYAHNDSRETRRIMNEVSRAVFAEIGVSPRLVVVTRPGALPKTPSGKLRRSETYSIIEAELEELDRSLDRTGARIELSA
jgi:fatty-acyl-CoA synthase